MTARKTSSRARRRTVGAAHIPKWIALWFAGERRIAFQAFSMPHCIRLREYWDAWATDHPGAIQPENFNTIARAGEAKSRGPMSRIATSTTDTD